MTTTATTEFDCETCYDTETIDHAGREIDCPDCSTPETVTIKLTGCRPSLIAEADNLSTCTATTATTMTFTGTRNAIVSDAARNAHSARRAARVGGRTGRNSISSAAIAIHHRLSTAN